MFSSSLAFLLFIQQDSLRRDKVWAMKREATSVTGCADYVPTRTCMNLLGSLHPLTSMEAGHGHPAEKSLFRSCFFFFVLNFEIYVKVFKVPSDEICQLAFFASHRKDANMEGEQLFLEGGACLWKYLGTWGTKFWVLVLETHL